MLTTLERIGHIAARRYATSLVVWLFTAPFMIIGLVFTELTDQWTIENVAKALLVGAGSHLALGLVLFVGGKTLLHPKRRESANWKQLLVVLGSAGLARGLVIASLAVALDVGDWRLLSRLPTSVVLVTFSFTVAAYASDLWVSYRTRRAQLLLSIAQGDAADRNHEIATSALLDIGVERDIEAARSRAQEAVSLIREQIRSGSKDTVGLDVLMAQTDEDWRSLSHKVWNSAQVPVPRITFLEFARTLALSRPLSLVVLSSGPVYGFFRIFDALPTVTAVSMFAAWVVGAVVLAHATNHLAAAVGKAGILVLAIGFVAIQLWAVSIGQWALLSSGLQAQVLYVSLASAIAALGMGLPQALERSGQGVLRELEEWLSASTMKRLRAQGDMFVLAKRMGTYLHSEVRGDFLRLAMELRIALENGDLQTSERVLDEMDATLGSVDVAHAETSPKERLQQFLTNWSSVIELTSDLDAWDIPGSLESQVEVVVMEAVNDAVRHGQASRVSIKAVKEEGGLTLIIDSDSEVPESYLPEGLGSRTLNQIAPNQWSREVAEEGTLRLSVTFLDAGKARGT